MSTMFDIIFNNYIERFLDTVIRSEYDADKNVLSVYVKTEQLGYVCAESDEDRVSIYAVPGTHPILLESFSVCSPDGYENEIKEQQSYAEAIIFDTYLTQWANERALN